MFLLIGMSTPLNAGIYKWTDENGKTHYSDKKPQINRFEDIEERINRMANAYSDSVTRQQEKLLENYEESIELGTPNSTDLYFVSFAGDSKQRVFMREAIFTKNLFDQNYNTKDKSTALINNSRTTEDYLVASDENLEYVLKTMGDKMNDEDIIYLYLTSHGSKNHKLSVDFPPHTVKDFGGNEVRRMLDEAGIKWRIIVISACYSGGFIEHLKTDHTLIATASDAKNTSFGCSDEREFTYFGEAIYKRQMSQGVGINKSLQGAHDIVSSMEKLHNYKSSNPQYWIGDKMQSKIGELEET